MPLSPPAAHPWQRVRPGCAPQPAATVAVGAGTMVTLNRSRLWAAASHPTLHQTTQWQEAALYGAAVNDSTILGDDGRALNGWDPTVVVSRPAGPSPSLWDGSVRAVGRPGHCHRKRALTTGPCQPALVPPRSASTAKLERPATRYRSSFVLQTELTCTGFPRLPTAATLRLQRPTRRSPRPSPVPQDRLPLTPSRWRNTQPRPDRVPGRQCQPRVVAEWLGTDPAGVAFKQPLPRRYRRVNGSPTPSSSNSTQLSSDTRRTRRCQLHRVGPWVNGVEQPASERR
jgi:hypothetical protein